MKLKDLFNVKHVGTAFLLVVALLAGSCSKEKGIGSGDNPPPAGQPVSFELKTKLDSVHPVMLAPDSVFKLEYVAEHVKSVSVADVPSGWTADLDEKAGTIMVKASAEAVQKAKITLKAVGEDTKEVTKAVEFYCLNSFTDPKGIFVLNEGNMTTENGSLTYITPEGYVIGDAYKAVNGTELGNVAQDMAFYNGKIYVITQNGDQNPVGTKFVNDGMLIVMNAKTLKKEMALSKTELKGLDWPTHIAVLDEEHVYLRDNAGIYRLNIKTKELKLVEGTEKAPKSQFVVMNGKVYTYKTGFIGGILEISKEADKAKSIRFPFKVSCPINKVLGIKAADDGDIWLMSTGNGKKAISKFNLPSGTLIQRQINVTPFVGSSGVAFAVKGKDFYYTDDKNTTVYRMTFDDNKELNSESGLKAEKLLCELNDIDDNAGLLYNGMAVHPVTGHVFINTIKGYAQFTTNQIWEFDFKTNAETPVAKYENYTHFPAGFFFAPNNN